MSYTYDYNHMAKLWEKTVPLRRRKEDVRPITKNRRDKWVIRKHGDVYALALYGNEVVKYLPDGSIIVSTCSYPTCTTADFIYNWTPFWCNKVRNKLWLRQKGFERDIRYPVLEPHLHMVKDANGVWAPAQGQVFTKKVTDRSKTKPVYQQIAPFMQWMATMDKLSDGVIHPETRRACCVEITDDYFGNHARQLLVPNLELAQYMEEKGSNILLRIHMGKAKNCRWDLTQAFFNNVDADTLTAILRDLPEHLYPSMLVFLALQVNTPWYTPQRPEDPLNINASTLKGKIHRVIRKTAVTTKEFTPSNKFVDRVI